MDMFAALKESFAENQTFLPALLSFVGGFLTALSPCIYPIVPVTIAVMGAHRQGSKWRNLAIAATYVSGMILLYTSLSIASTSVGMLAGSLFQHPAFIFVTGAAFIFFGAAVLGAFNFSVSPKILSWLSSIGGSGFAGAFLMGLVSGLVAAPCTGPVLGFLLTLIAKQGTYARGIFWMFFFAVGMGTPFLLLGAFSQTIGSLPKAGRFMTGAKMLLGGAIMMSGFYYVHLGYDCLQNNCAIGGASSQIATGKWIELGSSEEDIARLDEILLEAKQRRRPVVVDFFAHWCTSCKTLEKTLGRPQILLELERFVTVRVDATKSSASLTELQKRFGVVGLPTMVFISSQGEVLYEQNSVGVVELNGVLNALRRVP
jgi:thiol:disulfide interchange protein DsbD